MAGRGPDNSSAFPGRSHEFRSLRSLRARLATPSPQAQELGRRLGETIERFRREHPDTSPAEIREAVRMALAGRGGLNTARVGVLLAVIALLGGLGFLFMSRLQGREAWPVVATVIVFVLIIGLALAVSLKNR